MPNHITNYLEITSKTKAGAKQLQELYDKIYRLEVDEDDKTEAKKPCIDFNGTVPKPKELEGTTCPPQNPKEKRQQRALAKKYGDGNWYDWARHNWGTKWNAYDACEPEHIPNGYVFCFQTAWSPPCGWLEKTAKLYPALRFRDKWHDEGGGAGCLTLYHKKGELQVEDEAIPEHDWYYEFDEDYRGQYDFITGGDYDEVISQFQKDGEIQYGSQLPALLKRIKDEDLPLFMNFEWWDEKNAFEKRLKKMKTTEQLDAVYKNPDNQPSSEHMAKLKKLQRRAIQGA